MKKKILLVLAGCVICLQVLKPAPNRGVADTDKDITHCIDVPPHIHSILKRSCYDCHSNHTQYPWYSTITPINFWLEGHVEQGKKVFNFSDFSCYSKARLAALLRLIGHETAQRTVPLPSYLWIHKEAALSNQEVQEVVAWTEQEAQKLSLTEAGAAFRTSASVVPNFKFISK